MNKDYFIDMRLLLCNQGGYWQNKIMHFSCCFAFMGCKNELAVPLEDLTQQQNPKYIRARSKIMRRHGWRKIRNGGMGKMLLLHECCPECISKIIDHEMERIVQ